MKIVQERVDREKYLEVCISEREFQMIKDYMIISKLCFLHGEYTNVGIKLELGEDSDEE